MGKLRSIFVSGVCTMLGKKKKQHVLMTDNIDQEGLSLVRVYICRRKNLTDNVNLQRIFNPFNNLHEVVVFPKVALMFLEHFTNVPGLKVFRYGIKFFITINRPSETCLYILK